MQLHQLQYVVAAAKYGSFSQAAQALYVSQPALSQQIRKLEMELGLPLFTRHAKSVSLTNEGEEFLTYAQRITNELDSLEFTMNDLKSLSRSRLRIGALWTFGYLNMLPIVQQFSASSPSTKLSIDIGDSVELLGKVTSGELDVAFLIAMEAQLSKRELHWQLLIDDYYVLVVSNDNPLSKRNQLHISDLRNERIIMPRAHSNLREKLNVLFRDENLIPDIVCESSNTDVNLSLVSENLGVAFCSETVARNGSNGRYAIVPLTPIIRHQIYLVMLEAMQNDHTIQAFQKFITQAKR